MHQALLLLAEFGEVGILGIDTLVDCDEPITDAFLLPEILRKRDGEVFEFLDVELLGICFWAARNLLLAGGP